VDRFLCVPEKRPARRAHLRAHRQTAAKVGDLPRPRGCRKVRREFSRADRVPETTFHERRAASRCLLQELPDLCVVHERRDANEKTTRGGTFLGRTLYGVPHEAGDRVAKRLRREECLRSASALLLSVRPEDAQEQ